MLLERQLWYIQHFTSFSSCQPQSALSNSRNGAWGQYQVWTDSGLLCKLIPESEVKGANCRHFWNNGTCASWVWPHFPWWFRIPTLPGVNMARLSSGLSRQTTQVCSTLRRSAETSRVPHPTSLYRQVCIALNSSWSSSPSNKPGRKHSRKNGKNQDFSLHAKRRDPHLKTQLGLFWPHVSRLKDPTALVGQWHKTYFMFLFFFSPEKSLCLTVETFSP